jgi:hypothetical protein
MAKYARSGDSVTSEGTYNNYFKPLEEFRGLEAGVKAAEAFVHYKDKSDRATIMGL